MANEGFKRKLAAILSADAVEYSRLMTEDEEATIRTITKYRKLIAENVLKQDGRVVDSPGDNVLAEFASVVDALKCAVQIQKEIAERNVNLPDNRKMKFRIGVNLGDIAEDSGRIYGDGVNVAARIENLADPGGICISRTAYDQVKNRLKIGYQYLGEHTVKNIAEPVRVYKILTKPEEAGKVIGEKRRIKNLMALAIAVILLIGAGGLIGWYLYIQQSEQIEPASIEKMAYPLPDKPSIAVLPFDNMGDNPEDEYIANGLTEDIITTISKIDEMFVIARNSTFTYKNKPVKIKQVSEEFGVQYVLEGSIQRSGDRLRVTAQLIDALSGHHLWADRYDRKMENLFEIKDEITKKIVTELQVEITGGEQVRLAAKQTDNLEAWIHFSKGMTYFYDWSKRENNIKARDQLEQAVKIDPNFSTAWMMLGNTHMLDVTLYWSDNPAESFKKYFEFIQKAISLDKSSPQAHAALGQIYRRKGQFEKAIAEGEKSIALDPNNAGFYWYLSLSMHYGGRSGEAVKLLKKAMRLDPNTPISYLHYLGVYLHCSGRYEEAIISYGKALERNKITGEYNPLWIHNGLIASYLELGQIDNAGEHYKETLAIDPNNSFIGWAKIMLLYKDKDAERLKNLFGPLGKMYAAAEIKTKQYVYKETPIFKFEYPDGSKVLELTDSDQILRMRAPNLVEFSAYVAEISKGMKLEDIGPKFYLPKLKELGTNFDVISNESISLKDGTKAYKTKIKWLYKNGQIWITTLLVSAYKEDKCVLLITHVGGDPEEVAWIVDSLTFQ